MFADQFTSPVFTAALELWVAARTDEALHAAVVPLEQRVGREAHRIAVEALGVDESRPRVRELVQATLDLVRGLGLANTITDDTARRDRILAAWAHTLDTELEGHGMTDLLDQVLGDLDAEGAALEAMVAPLDVAAWSTPTPAVGWAIATQVAHLAWTDEVAVVAATDKQAWDELVLAAIGDPDGFVDQQALEGAKAEPADLLERWRRARPALQEALRGFPTGREDAVVRAADEPDLHGHGAVHGDLGALARRRRGARDRARADRPDPARGPPRRAHAQLLLRGALPEPPTEEFRVELTAPSGELWEWGPVDAAQSVRGSAYDFCLRVTQRRHRDDLDLVATGPDADRWLDIAQAFAGPPGEGVRPRWPSVRSDDVEIRVGNCSGFYGDRLSAMREMVEGGVDVVTGDYLAELTMLILGKDQLKDPTLGYAAHLRPAGR